jgi:glycosyltransferase involved in cell wall biosynthesis
VLILTDFPKFPALWKTNEQTGEALTALSGAARRSLLPLIPQLRRADLVLIHEGATKVLWFVVLFFTIFPFWRKPVVAVDLILRTPRTLKQKVLCRLRRWLFRRVDHFILYFKETRGYQHYYGIPPERCAYVPFKSNISANPAVSAREKKEDYVYMAGQSLRDFDTFFAAVAQLPYPAAIPRPNFQRLREHGARFSWRMEDLPKNLTLLEDNGSIEPWIRNLAAARIVVVPILKDNLCASGIGTYLDAMFFRKCVIISDGPGVSDVLSDELIAVPPEDPDALARAIEKVWKDASLRMETAARGHRYATALGAEPELMQRILDNVVAWYNNRTRR